MYSAEVAPPPCDVTTDVKPATSGNLELLVTLTSIPTLLSIPCLHFYTFPTSPSSWCQTELILGQYQTILENQIIFVHFAHVAKMYNLVVFIKEKKKSEAFFSDLITFKVRAGSPGIRKKSPSSSQVIEQIYLSVYLCDIFHTYLSVYLCDYFSHLLSVYLCDNLSKYSDYKISLKCLPMVLTLVNICLFCRFNQNCFNKKPAIVYIVFHITSVKVL